MKIKLNLLLAVLVLGSAQSSFGMLGSSSGGSNGGSGNQRRLLPLAFNEAQTVNKEKNKVIKLLTIPLAFNCYATLTKITRLNYSTFNANTPSPSTLLDEFSIALYSNLFIPQGISTQDENSVRNQFTNIVNYVRYLYRSSNLFVETHYSEQN